MADGQDQPRRSAIAVPKRKSNSILAHLLEDITPEEHRRGSELANNLFREIVRRSRNAGP